VSLWSIAERRSRASGNELGDPGAATLILEMSRPLEGMIKVSSAPLREALELIGH